MSQRLFWLFFVVAAFLGFSSTSDVTTVSHHHKVESICYPSSPTDPAKNKTHCYSTAPPFDDVPLPESPAVIAPVYHLYRYDETVNKSTALIIDDSHLLDTSQNSLIIIVHGFLDTFKNTQEWHAPIVNSFFEMMPTVHILYVEWAKGAAFHYNLNPYAQPSSNTRVIGDCLADFLQMNENLDPQKIHCIGFSLGSHVCGFFGKRYTSAKIGRITGLDPADLHFNKKDPEARLDKNDALFVDVVHTSRLGIETPIGTVDFYANNAKWQPGCSVISRRRLRRNSPIDDIEDALACSHHRAPLLYAQSILLKPGSPSTPKNCTFDNFCPCSSLHDFTRGRCTTKCFNAPTLGYWSYLAHKQGAYFGKTTATPPYCSM